MFCLTASAARKRGVMGKGCYWHPLFDLVVLQVTSPTWARPRFPLNSLYLSRAGRVPYYRLITPHELSFNTVRTLHRHEVLGGGTSYWKRRVWRVGGGCFNQKILGGPKFAFLRKYQFFHLDRWNCTPPHLKKKCSLVGDSCTQS